MKIETKYHGEVEINENDIISFESGIPGFLEEKKFTVLLFSEESPLYILQSLMTPQLAFVCANPFSFFKEYEFDLSDSIVEKLDIESEEDIIVLVILTVHEEFQKSTANLQAPIVINTKKQIGKQIVISDSQFTTKHLLNNSFTEQEVR
ncbi:flagellar assembly protein FliW [Cytobacillus suaedae]|nr:flagellar assembly protein FliW [Cytobacillus suaedae]